MAKILTAQKDVMNTFQRYYGRKPTSAQDMATVNYLMTKPPQEVESRLRATAPKAPAAKAAVPAVGKKISSPTELKKYKESDIVRVGKDIYLKPQSAKPKTLTESILEAMPKKADEAALRKGGEQFYNPWFAKEKQKILTDYKGLETEAKINQQKATQDYNLAMQRGDVDKAENIKRILDDYNKVVQRNLEDKQLQLGELERQRVKSTGQGEQSYQERGLYYSGAKEQGMQNIASAEQRKRESYERAVAQREADVTQQKQRSEADVLRQYERGRQDITSGYQFGTSAAQRAAQTRARQKKEALYTKEQERKANIEGYIAARHYEPYTG